MVSDQTLVARSAGLLSAQVGDEVVMLHLERNAYYDIDAVGAAIWDRLASPIRVGDLVDWLTARYDVERDACLRDVVRFLTEAVAEGVVCVVEAASPAA